MPANEWQRLNPAAVQLMQQRLNQNFASFATFCETTGLLRDDFLQIDDLVARSFQTYDPGYVCSMCAAAVVSAANHFGGQGDMETAKALAEWALLLEPECIPALLCLQTCATIDNDDETAQSYMQQARRIHEVLRLRPREELSAYQQGLVDAGKQVFGT